MDTGRGHLVYRFGDFELDTVQRIVTARPDGRRVKLTPRVYDTLLYLIEHAGELVTKTTLLQSVWSDVIVEEGNLTQTIHVLRRSLGESPLEHRYVLTVPGRGYRFIADVQALEMPPRDAPASTRAHGLRRVGTAAMLAGAVMTVAAGLYLAIEGDQAGSLHAQAVPASGESLRNDVAPQHIRAQGYLTQGRFFFYRRASGDLLRAREYLEQAQAIEPRDAAIPALLSGVYLALRIERSLPPEVALNAQRTTAERALTLDPKLAEGHLRLAQYYWSISDQTAAKRHLERGLALGPTHPLALSIRAAQAARAGRLNDAIELQQRSVAQEPLAAAQRANLGIYLLAAGRPRDAEAEFRQVQALNPALGNPEIAFALILQRRHDAALDLILRWPPGAMQDQALALAYFGLGHTRDAEAALDRLRAHNEPASQLRVAEVLASRGEMDAAFDWIERAWAQPREDEMPSIVRQEMNELDLRLSPFFTLLRDDQRWHAMFARG